MNFPAFLMSQGLAKMFFAAYWHPRGRKDLKMYKVLWDPSHKTSQKCFRPSCAQGCLSHSGLRTISNRLFQAGAVRPGQGVKMQPLRLPRKIGLGGNGTPERS